MNIKDIKPNPNNPRLIKDEKFKKLVQSIKEFPKMMALRPMVINKDNIILGGNMRFKALKELNYKDIPDEWIKRAEDLTEEETRRFIIADNVGFGEHDWEILANEWDSEQLEAWGLDLPIIFNDEVLEAEEDDFEVPDGGIETDIILGDLFEIGEHRLLCGDSTCSGSVAKLMNGEKSELLFTSPPYSDMREYNGEKDLSIDNLIEFIPTFLPYAEYQIVNLGMQRKNNEVFPYWDIYINKAKECGYLFLSWNIWDRMTATSIANQSAMFAIYHEWLFVFGKKPKSLNRTWEKSEESAKRAKSYKLNEKGQKVKGSRQKDGSIKNITAGVEYDNKNMGTVFSGYAEMERSIDHPAKFPISLPSEHIKAMTNVNDIITEPFLGSGTTMVASHQLKRKCYGMELDPKYCQVIINRMRKLDETLIIKRNGIRQN